MSVAENLERIKAAIPPHVSLVAVSKTHPVELVREAYEAGQRDFGENKVQELVGKAPMLPGDIRWHLIGHLQTNKVKYIAGFVHLVHSVDSLKLLKEINKEAQKAGRVVDCLLQVHIAEEETKFGLSARETEEILTSAELGQMQNVRITGLMGMATFTENETQVKKEFRCLNSLFLDLKGRIQHVPQWQPGLLSMGMSGDYALAIEEGSNMVRVGSAIFGVRNYGQT